MRARIGALALVVMLVAAACGGGGDGGAATSAPAGGGGGAAATPIAAICANVNSLKVVMDKLKAVKPADGAVALNMGANGVATQLATFVSAAPGDLRQAAEGLKAALAALRATISGAAKGGAGAEAYTTALAAVEAAWQELLAKVQASCPS